MKWEYSVTNSQELYKQYAGVEKALNALGALGWELVTVLSYNEPWGKGETYYFKRQVQ